MTPFDIAIRATPGASRNKVGGAWVGPDGAARLAVRVTAPPDSGRANKAIESLLCSAFDLPRSSVSVISGEKHRLKTVRLDGPDKAALKERYEELLGEGG